MIERSLKTLAVRVKQHNENALQIATFLSGHPSVGSVYYPGLQKHPLHEVARDQMSGFGGMLAFTLADESHVGRFLERLQVIVPSLSLGGVESIICQPAITSHVKMPEAERLEQGITNGLLRLSVGIEHLDDLIGDLKQAF